MMMWPKTGPLILPTFALLLPLPVFWKIGFVDASASCLAFNSADFSQPTIPSLSLPNSPLSPTDWVYRPHPPNHIPSVDRASVQQTTTTDN